MKAVCWPVQYIVTGEKYLECYVSLNKRIVLVLFLPTYYWLVADACYCLIRPHCSQLLLACDDTDDLLTITPVSVADWLASIKMDRYTEQFTSAGILTADDAVQLTLKDIVELGVTLVGHQKKIMNSVQALHIERQQSLQVFAAAGSSDDEQPTGSSCLI